ncbi:MAG TPA: response regulator [Acidimicrobiales bacterium]|nr:response regulator [Acidimicrobiales bacterium]
MKTVLVVDDDPDIRELITWKLTQAGYTTLAVGDGEAALKVATSGGVAGAAPDLILVDWMMPLMTGIEVCQALRDNPATERIPIILLTAKAQEAEVERGFAAGVDDYIVKPFSPREMLSRIQAVLARSEART